MINPSPDIFIASGSFSDRGTFFHKRAEWETLSTEESKIEMLALDKAGKFSIYKGVSSWNVGEPLDNVSYNFTKEECSEVAPPVILTTLAMDG